MGRKGRRTRERCVAARVTSAVLAGVFLLPLFSAEVRAQATAQINGSVADPTGAVLPGVEVTATQTATGVRRTAVTNETGSYVLSNLPLGPYRLEASLPGFRTYARTGIVLEVGSNPVIPITLEVGEVAETIEVQADALMVETRTTGVGHMIRNQEVVELPLEGRQAVELLFLTGMATPGAGATSTTTRNYPTIQVSVAGGLSTGVGYTLDGGQHNDPYNGLNLPMPFPDALQEFRVETAGQSARTGNYSSASVNVVTKSGTNEFHGNLFEFVRNDLFNARQWHSLDRDSLKRNQFGGTLGGPIIRDKFHFFVGYQGTTERRLPSTSTAQVPTPAMLAGDFTTVASAECQTRPLTLGGPFEDNRVDPALYSPGALKLQQLLPAPIDACGEVPFAKINASDEHIVPVRMDYQISDRHNMFGRYMVARRYQHDQYDGVNALTADAGESPLLVQSFLLGHSFTPSPTTVISLRGNVNRTNIVKTGSDLGIDLNDLGSNMHLYAVPKQPRYLRVSVSGGGGFSIGSNQGSYSHYNTTSFYGASDVAMVIGNHELGFGGVLGSQHMNALATVRSTAPMSFNGDALTGMGLADFLLGRPSSVSQGSPGLFYYRLPRIALYAHDQWRATPRLTVNLGLRWEPYIPVKVEDQGLSYFDRELFDQGVKSAVFPNAPAGLRFPGDEGMPENRRVGFKRMLDLAPRVGLSWDVRGDGRMSVRAAYGLFYNRPNLTTFGGYSSAPPNGNTVSHDDPLSLENPWGNFPGGDPHPIVIDADYEFPLSAQYWSVPLDAKATYQNQWNLTIQRQIGTDWRASASYVGNNTIHMWTKRNSNPGVVVEGATVGNTNQRRELILADPVEGRYFGAMQEFDTGGTGNYHGLQLGLQRRAGGLTVNANYTWSHCIADLVATSQTAARYVNSYDRSSSRGNCQNSDRRHSWNSSAVYRTPEIWGGLLGGWQISSILRIQTGSYFHVSAGNNRSLTGASGERANQLMADVFHPDKAPGRDRLWLNPEAFANPALGTWGNMGYNSIRGPHSVRVDMGLSRIFRVGETQSIQLRAEAFNLPNLVNHDNPTSSVTSAFFGQIRTAGQPRIMQFALKYEF